MKKILILSDLHVGSLWGLWPPSFSTVDARTGDTLKFIQNKTQKGLWKHWEKMLREVPDPEIIILNGDLIDGLAYRDKGRGLVTPNLTWQAEACLDILKTLPKVPTYFTQGTGYHELDDGRPVEEHLAREMGGEFGDDLIIDECGIRMQVGHTINSSSSSWQYWCYSGDTEVLTPNGWKKHEDVLPGESIATYFPDIGKLKFTPPKSLFRAPYTGDMIHFTNQKGSDIFVTPNHKMWVSKDNKWRFCEAETLLNSRRIDTLGISPFEDDPASGIIAISFPPATQDYPGHPPKHEEIRISVEDWAEFLGYYLSEGGRQIDPSNSNHQVTFSQKAPENIEMMESCFKKIGFHYSKRITPELTQFVFNRKQLWQYLERFGSKSDTKYIPRDVFDYPLYALRKLFNAMMLGDGTYDPRNGSASAYYTSSLQLANDFQELATRLGYMARVVLHYLKKEPHHKDMYRVYIKAPTNCVSLNKPDKISYHGYVVCFETETGLYLTRRLDSYPTIQGNTTAIARDLLLLALHNADQKYGKVDVAIRSHRHNFCGAIFKSQVGIITPCWQARTPFAVKKDLVSPPDIGYVVLHVGKDKNVMIDRSGITHQPGPPSRVVGRDRK